jgi:hypothetical protein
VCEVEIARRAKVKELARPCPARVDAAALTVSYPARIDAAAARVFSKCSSVMNFAERGRGCSPREATSADVVEVREGR